MFQVSANMILDKINNKTINPSEDNMGVKMGNSIEHLKLKRKEIDDQEGNWNNC